MDNIGIMGSLPDPRLFSFPPTNVPTPLAPIPTEISLLRPFNIPESIYQAALDARVPVVIAALYAATAKACNIYNLSRNKKPWAISKTRIFKAFVIAHNIFLAVYSAWTFIGMGSAMRRGVQSPFGPNGLAGTADSLCRLHGAPGLGNSVYYNEVTGSWESAAQDAAIENGLPSFTQAGRLWNEGLGYYGWIFYLSKFYEVLDTFIILAKGKPSSTLQTYHHAGAMICMWAGMRYMAIPIWVFVVYNSFIHTLMYTYYTLTAFSVKVPTIVKRSLTTMQIMQFLIGASYTMLHSFISYTVPVSITIPKTESDANSAGVPAGALDSLKHLVFRSSNIIKSSSNSTASAVSRETVHAVQPCILTAGETYAIWMNVVYLAPLTYLFVSFFIASYLKRSNASGKLANGGKQPIDRRLSNNVTMAEKAGWDAARGVEREVYGQGANKTDSDDSAVAEDEPVAKKTSKGKSKSRRTKA